MKNVLNSVLICTMVLVLTLASSFTHANVKNDKAIEKARAAVKNAALNDWKTTTKPAKSLILKAIYLDEALTWIEKSISINKNVENLEILGDYYFKKGNNR
jgi:hypothetical protein